jgi:ABC-type transport system involved in multi-copper enzyme maturation permease subunit
MIIKRSKAFFEQYLGFIISCFLLILISIILILLHVIIGADYPIARFSIFLFPVFMVQIGFLVHYLMSLKYEKVILTVIVSLALVSMIGFWQRANLYSSVEWAYDTNTKNMIQSLEAHRESNNPDKEDIKLGVNWLFEPTINYYRVTKGMDWLLPADRNGISKNDDYYYIFKDELNQLDSSEYEVIEEYNSINTLLIMNIKATNKE